MREQDTRHALLCGALAERYQASLVVAVERRVTNRHVIICGGADGDGERDGGSGSTEAAPPARFEAVRYLLPPREMSRLVSYPDYYGVRVRTPSREGITAHSVEAVRAGSAGSGEGEEVLGAAQAEIEVAR